jgi:hypothetical protein
MAYIGKRRDRPIWIVSWRDPATGRRTQRAFEARSDAKMFLHYIMLLDDPATVQGLTRKLEKPTP